VLFNANFRELSPIYFASPCIKLINRSSCLENRDMIALS